jgi:hypothetical protein
MANAFFEKSAARPNSIKELSPHSQTTLNNYPNKMPCTATQNCKQTSKFYLFGGLALAFIAPGWLFKVYPSF